MVVVVVVVITTTYCTWHLDNIFHAFACVVQTVTKEAGTFFIPLHPSLVDEELEGKEGCHLPKVT